MLFCGSERLRPVVADSVGLFLADSPLASRTKSDEAGMGSLRASDHFPCDTTMMTLKQVRAFARGGSQQRITHLLHCDTS